MKQKGFGLSLFSVVLGVSLLAARPVSAQAQTLLVAYAGQNETVGPIWIGVEKGTFKKYGLDVRMVQMRTEVKRLRTSDLKLFPSRRGKALCESKDQIIESLRLVNKERMPGCFENFDLSPRAILL